MSTTCSDLVSRAEEFNTLNSGLTSDSTEMLSRIRADQQALFTSVAAITRDYFKTTASLTSSSGSSARTFAVGSLTPPLERVLKVTLGDGRECYAVDELDTDAELEPRYFVRGTSLVEVGDDWGASGTKTATLVYVYGPTAITISGSLTQAVTVPDEWTDLLVLPLAMYLHTKDPGREQSEYEKLATMLDERQQAFTAYLKNFGGIESQRFTLPSPHADSRKK